MGGRTAEQLIFKDFSTGAANDIEVATNIARKMVCEWGMSDKIGPLTFGKKTEEVFLGREISHARDYSDEISSTIDSEITMIVRRAEKQAEKILRGHHDELVVLAEALLEYETISGAEMQAVISGKRISDIRAAQTAPKRRRRRSNRRKSENLAAPATETKQDLSVLEDAPHQK